MFVVCPIFHFSRFSRSSGTPDRNYIGESRLEPFRDRTVLKGTYICGMMSPTNSFDFSFRNLTILRKHQILKKQAAH